MQINRGLTPIFFYFFKTQELIFKKPHYSYKAEGMFYIPSDSGDKAAIFLPRCSNHSFIYNSWIKAGEDMKAWSQKLNLTVIEEKEVLK